ncbi:MAG: methyl-accepting chemotaxis protein [Desulfuromonadaceae bacterium]|nr:methyl-accepting chemotaxis protein [Desulfuromonadaceae bacterium]MDD5105277.1 methyl-accepting chemotaxis protein [Desulfuromonadaceae bacterium]
MAFQDIIQRATVEKLSDWRTLIAPSISTLRRMATTTEDEFLQIGSQLQSFYQRSTDVSGLAGQLVAVVSGEHVVALTERLKQMMGDMEEYLVTARARSNENCATMEQVKTLLNELSDPLGSFQKMNKTLRMLSISTKIESARLGEVGSGFINLAVDVEKLSHQVHEKSAAILAHRLLLATIITDNLAGIHATEADQDKKVTSILRDTAGNLQSLIAVNERCGRFGGTVASVSAEVSASIGDVVSSMQMHDMTRQQFEHIDEALERLSDDLADPSRAENDPEHIRKLIVEAGDICELQEAQLNFAAAELYTAVCTIVDSLREVAQKQALIADETVTVVGATDGNESGSSFVDLMSQGMTAITAVLASCAMADSNMSTTMIRVAQTIDEIAAFVTDIEEIGSEIDLIALNSQIKAALTGPEGAALGVLAEAIKRLSDEAVRQTDSVASTLKEIHTVTAHLLSDSEREENLLGSRVSAMQGELTEILRTMAEMNREMGIVLSGLNERVLSLTQDVDQATSGVDVHERTKEMADSVLDNLKLIVAQSREIEPASSQFKENLRHMEEHYTMESERHIHEALARKRSGQSAVVVESAVKKEIDDSEFGDNFDLF